MKEKIITTWSDVVPFAGKIVAYKCAAPTYYYTGNKYTVLGKPDYVFGLVNMAANKWAYCGLLEEGYGIEMLKKAGAGAGTTAIIDTYISRYAGGSMSMRQATGEELAAIKDALDHREADFGYIHVEFDIVPLGERAGITGADSEM